MLSAEPKAEADNTYRDFDYLGYHKGKENNDKHTVARNLNWIVIGNHALRAQPTD